MSFNDLMEAVENAKVPPETNEKAPMSQSWETFQTLQEKYGLALKRAELYEKALGAAQQILEMKAEEIEKLKATLEFYANPDNYDSIGAPFADSIRDFGEKARETLQEIGG